MWRPFKVSSTSTCRTALRLVTMVSDGNKNQQWRHSWYFPSLIWIIPWFYFTMCSHVLLNHLWFDTKFGQTVGFPPGLLQQYKHISCLRVFKWLLRVLSHSMLKISKSPLLTAGSQSGFLTAHRTFPHGYCVVIARDALSSLSSRFWVKNFSIPHSFFSMSDLVSCLLYNCCCHWSPDPHYFKAKWLGGLLLVLSGFNH